MLKKILSTGFLVLMLIVSAAPVFAQDVKRPAYCESPDEDVKKLFRSVSELSSLCGSSSNTCDNVSKAVATIKTLSEANGTDAKQLAAMKFVENNGLKEFEAFCETQSKLFQDSNTDSLQEVRKQLAELGNCASLDPSDAVGCLEDVAVGNETEIDKLQNAILRGDLVTILEEPIGDKGIFNRARICKTRFVRDIRGNLQLVNSEEVLDPTADVVREYRTETTDCRTYIVKDCKPTGAVKNTMKVNADGSLADGTLPITVFCDQVQIIYASSGVDLLKTYVGLIYRWAAGIIGVIAVLVVMISGIQMSASGGDSAKIDEAKERIIQSLVAIAVLFLSGIILYAINPTFFVSEHIQAVQEEIGKDKPDGLFPEGKLPSELDSILPED